jgi:hypothetical protein
MQEKELKKGQKECRKEGRNGERKRWPITEPPEYLVHN